MSPVAIPIPPVKWIIKGKFWDSILYSGKLYLFKQDGSLSVIRWLDLVSSLNIEERLRLAARCAFSNSNFLYGDKWKHLFNDSEIKEVIFNKFKLLEKTSIEINETDLEKFRTNHEDSPFPFPHADVAAYCSNLYAACRSGVFSANYSYSIKGHIRKKEQYWDCPSTSVSPAVHSLAVAAGNEGLNEIVITDKTRINLSKNHVSSCSRMFLSIYGSSPIDGGVFANFNKETKTKDNRKYKERVFDRPISPKTFFDEEGKSWGVQNRIYNYVPGKIHVCNYSPWEEGEARFKKLSQIDLNECTGELINAASALFGSVLEFDDSIVVIRSDGVTETYNGEPINWRIFPRSKNYENQLHIVRNECIEIYSYNHDYFTDQTSKLSGFSKFTKRYHKELEFEQVNY